MSRKYTLVINAGSSSLKFRLFDDDLKSIAEGLVERIGLRGTFVKYNFGRKEKRIDYQVSNHTDAIEVVVKVLQDNKIDFNLIKKIGHRVVHGGDKFIKPTLINAKILNELRKYNALAPLHNPNNIAGIEACLNLFPQVKNYAVFDTAFHSTIPEKAYLYPIPYKYYTQKHIRRYGFHGISNQYVTEEVAKKLKKKQLNIITCHLGSGCSVTAVEKGKSVDTSMGFTPLEGLMMSSRSGDIDPGVIFKLNYEGMTVHQIDRMLNFESGLVGVSGLNDMRDIMIANGYKVLGYKSTIKFDPKKKRLAKIALQLFVYKIQKYIGAYSAVLGKVDAVVFTAGVGERNKDVRNLIMKGINLKTKTLVIPTNEELMIAKLIK